MTSVQWMLQAKGEQVWSTTPEATVFEALEIMADKDIGVLLVMENERLVGIFSERDYARKVILKGKSSSTMLVREIMTSEVFTVRLDQTIEQCMKLMTDRHIRHLPVVEKGKVLGLISIGDVVKTIISDQRTTIRQLEEYITGRR